MNEFLLGDDNNDEPVLYSAENGSMQPITSPAFMVSGIYKRIAGSASVASTPEPSENVYLSEKEPHGRIIRSEDFKKLYICVSGGDATRLPRRVVLLRKKEKLPLVANTNSEANFKALTRLAHNILKYSCQDHIVIDRKQNKIVRTENGTNQQTIYRIVAPEALMLKPPPPVKPLNDAPIKLKLGRPKKRNGAKTGLETYAEKADLSADVLPEEPKVMRTRFGRTVKCLKPSLVAGLAREGDLTAVPMGTLMNDLRDADYQCNHVDKLSAVISNGTPHVFPEIFHADEPDVAPNQRRFPPEAYCPGCDKIFLGRRMQKHFLKYPEHARGKGVSLTQATPWEDMSLFRFLRAKLQRPHMNEDQRAELFLNEISDFVEQLQLRSSRLIRNASGLHLVNGGTARVLGIPEGHYAFDMQAIEGQPLAADLVDSHTLVPTSSLGNNRHLDYTQLSMSLDNTITDEAAQKLNLSAGGNLLPPSEDTLLRVVEDLVHDDIKQLDDSILKTASKVADPVPHYDHASDNAVEALTMKETPVQVIKPKKSKSQPILDLAVDFFKFANNNTK